MIAMNEPGFLKCANTSQTGRRGYPGTRRQVDIGNTAVILEIAENPEINGVELYFLQRRAP